jgi:hypothetical protein
MRLSRLPRFLLICLTVLIALPATALKIEALVFAKRVAAVTNALSRLKIGEASRADAIDHIPGLKDATPSKETRCSADECLSIAIPTPRLSRWLLMRLTRTGNTRLNTVLHWWGFRLHDFDADVDITSGRVSHVAFRLMLSTPEPYYPGVLVVGVSSVEGFHERRNNRPVDEGPSYRVTLARQFPDLSMGVVFTSVAPAEIVHRGFDLQLKCLATLKGCRTVEQLLPAAAHDGQRESRSDVSKIAPHVSAGKTSGTIDSPLQGTTPLQPPGEDVRPSTRK